MGRSGRRRGDERLGRYTALVATFRGEQSILPLLPERRTEPEPGREGRDCDGGAEEEDRRQAAVAAGRRSGGPVSAGVNATGEHRQGE